MGNCHPIATQSAGSLSPVPPDGHVAAKPNHGYEPLMNLVSLVWVVSKKPTPRIHT